MLRIDPSTRYSIDNFGVGTVIRSEKPEFKPGDFVYGYLGR